MLRGTLYATIGIAFALTGEAWTQPIAWPFAALLTWPWVVIVAGPLLVLAAIPLSFLQGLLREHLTGRLIRPAAILAGLPFGFLVCFLVLRFFGKPGSPWTDASWAPWLPESLAAGLGLGLGGAHDLKPGGTT